MKIEVTPFVARVSDPPAFSSEALRAATQSGSFRKLANDSAAASRLLWARI
jgi:hypothetical protein